MAYSSTAIPDTLGGSGVLLETKEPDKAAWEICRLVEDREKRENVLRGQRKRLQDFSHDSVRKILVEQMTKFINGDT